MLKIITISFLLLLNGCIQNTTFLGPVIAGVSSGSVHQAALSYGSNKAITQITGKTSAENIRSFLEKNKDVKVEKNKDVKDKIINEKNFFKVVKKVSKRNDIKNLVSQ
tara:strand:- start:74 stop:397 length:324 start_codon:yes stop_codon:yes gene_type:complete